MAQIFGTITHASNISTNDHLMAVLENVDAFNSSELEIIRKKTAGKRYITLGIYLLLNQCMLFWMLKWGLKVYTKDLHWL